MKKEKKLVQKVKCLIRRVGLPRWLHRFGPKKYEFLDHAIAYLVKQECRLGYRRVTRLLRWLGHMCPCPSALCMSFNKLPLAIWKRLLLATVNHKLNIVAIDGTGLSRPLPSPYYYKRIDRKYPSDIPLKLSIAVDTQTKKVISLRLRSKMRHDIKDAKYLINNLPSKPKVIVADKGYDAEWLHHFCQDKGIKPCIPVRNKGKPRVGITRLRHLQKHYHPKRYHRRELVESIIGAIKRKFGCSASSTTFSAQRAEMYCRAIAHNIISLLNRHFERSPYKQYLYKEVIFPFNCEDKIFFKGKIRRVRLCWFSKTSYNYKGAPSYKSGFN